MDLIAAFKRRYSLEARRSIVNQVIKKYPDRVPIIVMKGDKRLPELPRPKYIVPRDITLSKFIYEIRKNMYLRPEQAIYLFVNNMLPPCNMMMGEIYDRWKDEDGLLYIIYSSENTFGVSR